MQARNGAKQHVRTCNTPLVGSRRNVCFRIKICLSRAQYIIKQLRTEKRYSITYTDQPLNFETMETWQNLDKHYGHHVVKKHCLYSFLRD